MRCQRSGRSRSAWRRSRDALPSKTAAFSALCCSALCCSALC
jgi:hypothetical protein